MQKQEAFLQLKPACVGVLQATASLPQRPSARTELNKTLTTLSGSLQDVAAKPGALDAKLADYAFVPISQVLRISRSVPVRALELCLECISTLLKAGWGGALSPELSGQLLILFTFMAKPSSAENGIAASSEELQTLALRCTGELFSEIARTPQARQQLTVTANIPALGEAVLVVLESLTGSSSNTVKLQATTTIGATISAIDDKDALASFLPRMVSSLTKVLTPSSSNRASFRVLERALKSLSSLFARLLGDQETKGLSKTDPQSPETSKVVRSSSWLQATASQIKVALSNILKLRKHDKVEVRKALLDLCLVVLQECRDSLASSTSLVVETMVTLAGREPNGTIEKRLASLLSADDNLSNCLRESLHGWIIALPRVMQSKDDTGRQQTIHQISVTLRLLGDRSIAIDDLLAGSLRDGVSAVLNDSKGSLPISAVGPASDAVLGGELVLKDGASNAFEPLKLRLKGQEVMMVEFKLLLEEVAKSNTAEAVLDDLVNSLGLGSEESRLASFWISVNLLRDTMEHSPPFEEFIDIGKSGPQEELLDNLYSYSLSILNPRDSGLYTNWHFPALALEVVALQAMKYKAEFRAELGETLYPVLHYLGSGDPGLRNHAVTCLNIIARSCNYSSASALVIDNVDYIVNAVGLRLSYGDVSPQAPQVLLMMMRLCGPSLLPYLDDLVSNIFGALERYHGYPKLVELLFTVLKGMAEEGVKTPQLTITNSSNSATEAGDQNGATQIVDFFNTIRKIEADLASRKEDIQPLPSGPFPQKPWKELTPEEFHAQTDVPQDDTPLVDEQVPSSKDHTPPPPAPRTFDILLKISDLTQHYLTSSSPSLRTSLLSLLSTTIPALAKHETSFLPLINTLWPVLLPRLQDPEAYIVANSLEIVTLMCTHAEDFMRSRIQGAWDVIGAIHKRTNRKDTDKMKTNRTKPTRLVELSNITNSNKALTSLAGTPDEVALSRPELYVDAPSRMMWDALVRLLCAISKHVYIQDALFDDIVDILDPVLDTPAVKEALDHRNADAVWLRLYKKNKEAAKEKGVQWEVPPELGGPVRMPPGSKELGFANV